MDKMQRKLQETRRSEKGFTLVELSIVLVIIGLIVGGVLVGQELIKGAEIRALLSQMERYNSATNTFRNKFGYVPGDVPTAQTVILGLQQVAGVGNGNRMLEFDTAACNAEGCGDGERSLFYAHLSEVNMIEGQFDGVQTDGTVDLNGTFPPGKAGTAGIAIYEDGSFNYYHVGITGTDNTGAYTFSNALTQEESYEIDRKIDDGKPQTGIVRASNGEHTAYATDDDCLFDTDGSTSIEGYGTTNDDYNLQGTNAGSRLCQLMIRMQ